MGTCGPRATAMGDFHSKPSISQGQGLITIRWAFLTSSPSALWFPEVGITLWGQDPTLLSQDPTPTNLLNAMVRQHLGSTMARELLCPAPEPCSYPHHIPSTIIESLGTTSHPGRALTGPNRPHWCRCCRGHVEGIGYTPPILPFLPQGKLKASL